MKSREINIFDDALLLPRLQEGDKQAFKILYKKYWTLAYSSAYDRLRDSNQAKEIVQQIFVNIWLRRENLIINFHAYLIGAVRNEVFKLALEKKKTVPFLESENEISTYREQADANMQYQEFYKAYEAIISTLPPKKQLIFRLRFHDDLTTKAIADEMGISRKTVQNQLGRAIEQIRLELRLLF